MLLSKNLTIEELHQVGFKAIGTNVTINQTVLIAGNPTNISLASNVKIDAYTILHVTGPLEIGNYVHIGDHCFIGAGNGVRFDDFSGVSQGVRIYSGTDDFSGEYMTNPTVPRHLLGNMKAPVYLGKHVAIGSGSIVLPGVNLHEGVAITALSLVNRSMPEWTICAGIPARPVSARKREPLELCKRLLP